MTTCALMIADDPLLSDLSAYVLRRDGIEVVVAGSKQDALQRLTGRTFDLLIIYAAEFDSPWQEFCRAVRTDHEAVMLVIAGQTSDAGALAAYEAGADDYFALPTSPSVFLAKVRAWFRRTARLSPRSSLQVGPLELDPNGRRLRSNFAPPVRLSSLEYHVLHLLMLHAGQVLPASFILQQVWGCNGKEDAALVKNVVYRLRRKIEDPLGGAVLVETAEDGGYLFHTPES